MKSFLLGVSILIAVPVQAQQTGTITGRVSDQQTGQPLSAAQVHIPELNIGVLTQQNGRFILLNVPAGTHTVVAERIGYRQSTQAITVEAGGNTERDLFMSEEALQLSEIIVTGTPGGTQRRAIGNVVSRVNAEEITEKQAVASMQEMLSGRTPGLDFERSSGNVGTGSTIRIRGVSSIGLGAQPLIYVDGVRVDNSGSAGPTLRGGAQSSALDDFNPRDIASIEVIKGPAAATLYGTEASAGVIQIITKKGQSGAPQFNLTVNQGSTFMIDPAGRIGDQYGRDPETGEIFSFNVYEHEKRVNGNNVFRYGHNQGYNLSVRGGTDAIRYYLSGDWDDQQGVVNYNWNNRLSMRANVGVLISENLNLDVSTGYTTGETSYMQQLEQGGIWEMMYWADGNLLDSDRRGFLRYTPEELETVAATRQLSRFTGSMTMTHNSTEWLTQRLIMGLDRGSDENQVLVPRHPLGDAGPFRNLNLGDVQLTRPITTEMSLDYSASAKYPLGDRVGLTTSVGAQYFSREENTVLMSGKVFASPAIRSIEGATNKNVNQVFIQNKSLGVYFQQEASINDRIYLTAAVRADDNSAFGADFNAAIYPKLSAAWVLSDEDFWRFGDYIGSFRLRSAWGKAGRQPSTFAAVTLFTPSVGPGGSAAVSPGTLGNPEVGPEVSQEIELGFDAAFLDDRITTEFTYFSQRVKDMLVSVPLVPSMGFAGSQDANLGRMDNWGWELGVNARVVQRRNWALDLGFGGDHTRNRIVDLGGRTPTNSFREGFPYPVIVSDVILSAEFDEFGRPTNAMCDSGTGLQGRQPGGPAVPCAETEDYELLLGTRYPQYTWSFDGTLTLLRNLQLFGMVNGEFAVWGADNNASCRHTCYPNVEKSFQTDDPLYAESVFYSSRHPNDGRYRIYYDAAFWKLREVGARYQLPESWLRGMNIESASISATGRNLWTIWQRTKDIAGAKIADVELQDPVSSTRSSMLGQMPGVSSFTLSLRVSF